MTRRSLIASPFAFQVPSFDHSHTSSHVLSSARQLYDTTVRVASPSRSTRRLLLVLPVNPDINHRWGDGFDTIVHRKLHEKYGFAIAAPSFTAWPWFADHPTNPKLRQESYLLEDVLPLLDRLFPAHRRLLVGFSKSGNGALQLLLRHPDRFAAAAAWDAPLMKRTPDQFNMGEIYGTQENFDKYAIPALLEARAPQLQDKPPRIAISGYDAFQQHTSEAHQRMDSLRIPHLYDNDTRRMHRWDSGWIAGALQSLDRMAKTALSGV